MSKNPNATAVRYRGILFGFVLGAAAAAIVMGYLWRSDSAVQEERIEELSAQLSARDETIETLYSQLSVKNGQGGSETVAKPPAQENR